MKKHIVTALLREGPDRNGAQRYDVKIVAPNGVERWGFFHSVTPPDAMVKRVRHNIAWQLHIQRHNMRVMKGRI